MILSYLTCFTLLGLMICSALPNPDTETGSGDNSLGNVIRQEFLNKLKAGKVENNGQVNPENKIIGGWSSTNGMVPYQVHIRLFNMEGEASCGATLISRRHVVTAAHCLYGMLGALVTLGSTNKNSIFGVGIQSYLVDASNFISHPDYNDYDLSNDIGIIRLPSLATSSFNIRPIALPSSQQTGLDYFAGKQGLISGFGKTSDHYYDIGSTSLQMANADIMTLEDCQKYWKEAYPITDKLVCTRFNGSGTCQGDSGGPLAAEVSNRMVLVGITSFGAPKCHNPAPNVYTNVPSYMNWINSVVSLN